MSQAGAPNKQDGRYCVDIVGLSKHHEQRRPTYGTNCREHCQPCAAADRHRHGAEVYRPAACPYCRNAGLWRHACCHRKAGRSSAGGDESLNPVALPRFVCRACLRTCSRLPACSLATSRTWPTRVRSISVSSQRNTGKYSCGPSDGGTLNQLVAHAMQIACCDKVERRTQLGADRHVAAYTGRCLTTLNKVS